MTAAQPEKHQGSRGLVWIGCFKLVKGLLLVVFATGMLASIHQDLQASAEHLVKLLHFDADNRYIARILNKVGLINGHKLKELGGLTFVYGALFLTEGTGLILRKRWAEYLTVIATCSFIPIEVYEVWRHCTLLKVGLLGLNVLIVVFLIVTLRRKSEAK
jgi:uncharacterized membrane protein (DUF2068 family)